MPDPDQPAWMSFTIPKDADSSDLDAAGAAAAFAKAMDYYLQNDSKTEWYDNDGNTMARPSSVESYVTTAAEIGWYQDMQLNFADAHNSIQVRALAEHRTSDLEALKKKIGDPLNMGMYAKEVYKKLLADKAVADALWNKASEGALPPATNPENPWKAEVDALEGTEKIARDLLVKGALDEAQKEIAKTIQSIPEARSIQFKEQCFLLAKIFQLVKYKLENIESKEVKTLPYLSGHGNASIMVHSDPFAFINRLAIYDSQTELLTMPTSEISNLQPRIRLFKVMEDKNGDEIEQEYNFNANAGKGDHSDPDGVESLLKSRDKRGFGVGIENFSITYEGSDPFAAKRMIKGTLTLHANGFDEILKIRGPSNFPYSYADLALKTGGTSYKKIAQKINPNTYGQHIGDPYSLNFRLKAVVGWSPPARYVSSGFQNAIDNSSLTVNLIPVTHEFRFDDDGTIKFIINYQAYMDTHFDQAGFSIFSGTKNINSGAIARKIRLQQLNMACDAKAVTAFKKSQMNQVKSDRKQSMKVVMTSLFSKGKIRFISLPDSDLQKFNSEGPFYELKNGQKLNIGTLSKKDTAKKDVKAEAGKDDKEEEGKNKPVNKYVANPNDPNVSFFFLSDLVDVVLEGIENRLSKYDTLIEEAKKSDLLKGAGIAGYYRQYLVQNEQVMGRQYYNSFKKMRIVLGPLELVNPSNPSESVVISIGDLPISVKYFNEWLVSETVQRGADDFTLASFVKKFIVKLTSSFINDASCFSATAKQGVRLREAVFTAYKDDSDFPSDPLTQLINELRNAKPKNKYISRLFTEVGSAATKKPILNTGGVTNTPIGGAVEDEYNYLIFYASRATPFGIMNGNVEEDLQHGIHHYSIGLDRGIVKRIQLKRDTRTSVKEMRFEQEGYDGLQQLREVYHVDLECYANPHAFPGAFIFVDPRGWVPYLDPEVAKRLDIENLTDFGIGGYYLITKSEHVYGIGEASTMITAMWHNGITRTKPPAGLDEAKFLKPDQQAESVTKCSIGGEDHSKSNQTAKKEPPTSVSAGRMAGLKFVQDLMIKSTEAHGAPEDNNTEGAA